MGGADYTACAPSARSLDEGAPRHGEPGGIARDGRPARRASVAAARGGQAAGIAAGAEGWARSGPAGGGRCLGRPRALALGEGLGCRGSRGAKGLAAGGPLFVGIGATGP